MNHNSDIMVMFFVTSSFLLLVSLNQYCTEIGSFYNITFIIYYWSLLKIMLNDKKFLASHLFFTITNLLLILAKKPVSLILLLQNSAQLLKTTVAFPH